MNPLYRNTYQTEVPTVAVKIEPDDKGSIWLTVRDLAFHPGGGGHPQDRGTVEICGQGYEVQDLRKGNGDVQIVLAADAALQKTLVKGEPVLQRVNRERRLKAARFHSLQHAFGAAVRMVVAGAAYRTGGMTIAEDLSHCSMRFGTAQKVTSENITAMIQRMRAAIDANLPVRILMVPSVDAAREIYGSVLRVDPTLSFKGNRLRLVTIGEQDSLLQDASLCGGNHITSLGEAPMPEVTDFTFDEDQEMYQLQFTLV